MTKRYGILAYPAKHSLSPALHNAAFKALGIDAAFEFFEIPEEDFDGFMKSLVENGISGLAVSLPYKETIMKYLDEVDEAAKEIGAVNTVVNRDGRLYGYNTDYIGVERALEGIELKNKSCVVIGAGGAARGVLYALLKKGARVGVYNRTKAKAEELAKYFEKIFAVEIEHGDLQEMTESEGDILINTSSIWLDGSAKLEDLVPEAYIKKFSVVMDIIYKPLITPLIEAAKKVGASGLTGDKMFLYQAMEQFKLWTGKEAPEEAFSYALESQHLPHL